MWQMSVYMNRCVVECVSRDRIIVLGVLLWLQWELFGELFEILSVLSRSLLLSVFPLKQRGLFTSKRMQFKFIFSGQSLLELPGPSRRWEAAIRKSHKPFTGARNAI